MDSVNSNMQMETNIQENLKMIELVDSDSTNIAMEQPMMENGMQTAKMELVKNHGMIIVIIGEFI